MYLCHPHQGIELGVFRPNLSTRAQNFSAKTVHRGANCFPISQSSSDLDWRTVMLVLLWQKQTINFIGDTIILVSGHKVLAFSSRLGSHVWRISHLCYNEF